MTVTITSTAVPRPYECSGHNLQYQFMLAIRGQSQRKEITTQWLQKRLKIGSEDVRFVEHRSAPISQLENYSKSEFKVVILVYCTCSDWVLMEFIRSECSEVALASSFKSILHETVTEQ